MMPLKEVFPNLEINITNRSTQRWKNVNEKSAYDFENVFFNLPMENIVLNGFLCSFKYFEKIWSHLRDTFSGGSRIFPRGGRQLPKWVCLFIIFAENCMKMKEFGPRGARVPGAPLWIRQWLYWHSMNHSLPVLNIWSKMWQSNTWKGLVELHQKVCVCMWESVTRELRRPNAQVTKQQRHKIFSLLWNTWKQYINMLCSLWHRTLNNGVKSIFDDIMFIFPTWRHIKRILFWCQVVITWSWLLVLLVGGLHGWLHRKVEPPCTIITHLWLEAIWIKCLTVKITFQLTGSHITDITEQQSKVIKKIFFVKSLSIITRNAYR